VYPIKSQELPQKFKIFKAKVKLLNSKETIKGALFSLEDSSVTLITVFDKNCIKNGEYGIISVPINDIKIIKVRRLGKTGRSMAIGTAIGFGTAATIAILEGPDDCLKTDWCQDVGEKITMYSFLFVPPGLIIGTLIGAPSKKYGIYGNMNFYNEYKPKLIKYTILE
jgi:hypothetical protein